MPKVLVVDDAQGVHDMLGTLFATMDVEPLHAKSATEALEIFKREPVDVVLTDVRMDRVDGITFLRKLKKLDDEAVVIVMTAFDRKDDILAALKLGAFDFFIKPFAVGEFTDSLRRAIVERERRRAGGGDATGEDADALRALRDHLKTREKELEAREARLAADPGQAAVKDEDAAEGYEDLDSALQEREQALEEREEALAEAEQAVQRAQADIEHQLMGLGAITGGGGASDGNERVDFGEGGDLGTLDEREASIAEREAMLTEREAYLEQSENALFEKGQTLQELETELDHRRDQLEHLEKSGGGGKGGGVSAEDAAELKKIKADMEARAAELSDWESRLKKRERAVSKGEALIQARERFLEASESILFEKED